MPGAVAAAGPSNDIEGAAPANWDSYRARVVRAVATSRWMRLVGVGPPAQHHVTGEDHHRPRQAGLGGHVARRRKNAAGPGAEQPGERRLAGCDLGRCCGRRLLAGGLGEGSRRQRADQDGEGGEGEGELAY